MNDPRMKEMGASMPFDGQRMIYGGFASLSDQRGSGKLGYVDGTVIPVPAANKSSYAAVAAKMASVFREHGAIRVVDA